MRARSPHHNLQPCKQTYSKWQCHAPCHLAIADLTFATNVLQTTQRTPKRGEHVGRGTKPRRQPEENDECCQDCLLPTSPTLGWAVRDIDTTIKNFEDLGLGPWRRYILGEADGGHDFVRRDYEGGLDNRAKVALSKWGPIAIELFEPIYFPILEKFLETHG
jgi:hypothetical protein